MKHVVGFLALTGALFLQGCDTMQPNPQFRNCANACSKKQDSCMIKATTADDIARCNSSQNSCVAACEQKFPRYIQP